MYIPILIADSTEPSTLMGQFMEALNSQTNLDDLNLNIDSFQGGLECNVDEVSAIARYSYILMSLIELQTRCVATIGAYAIIFIFNKSFPLLTIPYFRPLFCSTPIR